MPGCDDGRFACTGDNGLTCVDQDKVCDGKYDCEDPFFNPDDFSDEENCTTTGESCHAKTVCHAMLKL